MSGTLPRLHRKAKMSWLRRLFRPVGAPKPRERKVSEAVRLVSHMVNWQRHQWARAGYPKKVSDLRRFAKLTKGNRHDLPGKFAPKRAG